MDSFYRLTRPLAIPVAAAFLSTAIPRNVKAFEDYNIVQGDSVGVYTGVEPGDRAARLPDYFGAPNVNIAHFLNDVYADCEANLPRLAESLGLTDSQVEKMLRRYNIDNMTANGPGKDKIIFDQIRPTDLIYVSYDTMHKWDIDQSAFGSYVAEPVDSLEARVGADSVAVSPEDFGDEEAGVVIQYNQFIQMVEQKFGKEFADSMERYINVQVSDRVADYLARDGSSRSKGSWFGRHPWLTGAGIAALAVGAGVLGSKIGDDNNDQSSEGHYEELGGGNGIE